MLNWFTKYRSPFAAKPATASPAAAAPKPAAAAAQAAAAAAAAADKAQRKAQARAQQADADQAAWAPRLQAALADDAALLAVALDCPVLALRQAAVEAMASEPTLAQAEAAFRNKDRRVHQVAKRRLEAAVLRRETQAKGQALLASAQTLAAQPVLAVNHLVLLDRDWAALDPALMTPPLADDFSALRQTLGGLAQAQSALQQGLQRRHQAARQSLAALLAAGQALLDDNANGALDFSALAAAADGVQAELDPATEPALGAPLQAALQAGLGKAGALRERLQWLADFGAASVPVIPADAVAAPAPALTDAPPDSPLEAAVEVPVDLPAQAPQAQPVEAPTEAATQASPEASRDPAAALPAPVIDAATPPPSPAQAWGALPPLADAGWAAALDQRFEQARRQHQALTALAAPAAAPAPPRPPRRAAAPQLSPAQRDALALHLDAADQALADGHLGPLQQHLQAFDKALAGLPALPANDALAQRAGALQAEHQRLRGWQQWGGGRARDDLAAEAEVLARATAAAAADPALANAPKLDLSAHAEAINTLRGRWRELDRLGAAASQALWQRFDAALKAAYQPVADRQAVQKAQRQQNQREREALLAALEAWPGAVTPAADAAAPLPNDAATPSPSDEAATPSPADPAAPAADAPPQPGAHAEPPAAEDSAWKDRLRTLDRFHTAWRQLGPLEHTVPAGAREPLRQRHQRAVDRLEAPLQQARREAASRREALIARADALASQAATTANATAAPPAEAPRRAYGADAARRPVDDLPQQMRNLQAEWQQQARELPLARGVEAALWGRFRAALDSAFAQRQAVWNARDADAAQRQSEREAWITRLAELPADAAPADARKLLVEADQAWRQPLDLPRGAAAALDARYRDARSAVQQRLADAQRQQWQAGCDALAAGLAQALQREQAGSEPGAAPAEADPALPDAWARALAQRGAAAVAAGPLPPAAFDALLLQLEAALEMPASAEQQAARRLLKLQALKQTLEGRPGPAAVALAPADALVAALRQACLPAAQQQRLQALLAALRQAAPGTLGTALPRA